MTGLKRIPLKHLQNCRDLGGIPLPDCRMTGWNRLYRSDNLSGLEPYEWEILRNSGISTILDLRSNSEQEQMSYTVPEGFVRYSVPLMAEDLNLNQESPGQNEDLLPDTFSKSLTAGYQIIVREDPAQLAHAVRLTTDCLARGGVLFHCTAGKDRTGILAAALLWLLGAAREDIVADYEVSFTFNRTGVNRMVSDQLKNSALLPFLHSDASNMEELIDLFEELRLESFLIENGMPEDTVSVLKREAAETVPELEKPDTGND